MTAPPPPPPFRPNEVEEKAPPIAWLIPAAGALAVIGGVLPWFDPVLTFRGRDFPSDDPVHSWDDGKIGLAGPVIMAAIGISAVLLLMGRNTRFHRGSTSPIVNLARGSMIGGAVGIVALVIAWFILPSQYKDWDRTLDAARRQDPAAEIGHGPQIGLWLTGAAAVIAIVAGVMTLVMRTKAAPGAQLPGGFGPPAPQGYQQPQGQQPQGQQPQGYAPPAVPPQGYGPPPQGYGPPQGYAPPPPPTS